MGVGEELDLDVPRTLQVTLEEDSVVTKSSLGLTPCRGRGLVEVVGLTNDSHPASASACGCLDHQREADLAGLSRRQDGDACCRGGALRFELVAAAAKCLGTGADEDEEHTPELQSLRHLVCRLLLDKKKGVPSGLLRRANVLLGIAEA